MFSQLAVKLNVFRGKINPFKIKPEYCSFDIADVGNSNQQISAYLANYNDLNSNHIILRFETSELNKCLGLSIGQYVHIKEEQSVNSISQSQQQQNQDKFEQFCWPISRIDDCGLIDVIVSKKQYQQIQQNKVNISQQQQSSSSEKEQDGKENNQQENQEQNKQNIVNQQEQEQSYQFTISGPHTKYVYQGSGNFKIKSQENNEFMDKKIQYLGLLCQNEYIGNLFQLIEGVSTNGDPTNLSLLQFSESLEESILLEELAWMKDNQKLNYQLFLKDVDPSFIKMKGELGAHYIQDYLPAPDKDNSLIIVSGDNQFKEQSLKYLNEVGHQNESIIII